MRYNKPIFASVIVVALSAVFLGARDGGGAYADEAAQPRDERSDCNGNGVTDAFETSPLAGYALGFDGVNDYVIPASALALRQLGQGDFTLEAWVCTSDTRTNTLISNLKITSRYYHFVITNASEGGVLRFTFKDGEDSYECTGVTGVADGRWHHVAVVRATASRLIILYVDGQLDALALVATTSFTANEPTLIGRDQYASPHYFAGAIDEVRMWSVECSRSRIVANMYGTLDGNEDGLVAYWRFDEGSGSIAYDSAGNHDGTLVGSPTWAQSVANCNLNGIPDECEVGGEEDCNSNGIPDLCDIYEGTSYDCASNGIPDECEMLPTDVIYVDDSATSGMNTGGDWANAYRDLNNALAYAAACDQIYEIRVAGGTYKPGTSREDSFHPLNGVALRGGYRGLQGSGNPNERDIDAFESILSGDLGDPGYSDDNCYHVVTCAGADASSLMEGFTITGGNCIGTGVGQGGGVSSENGSPTFVRCKFSENRAEDGGGIWIADDTSPTLINCTFVGNTASYGAGVYNAVDSSGTLTGCTFIGNRAYSGGGGTCNANDSSATFTNCVFSGNSATNGGGASNWVQSYPTFISCTISGNNAGYNGGGIHNLSDDNTMVNCIVWGNTADYHDPGLYDGNGPSLVTYSCIQGGFIGTGNITADPFFVDADGADNTFGTADDDLRLMAPLSPCIDAGSNSAVPVDTLDLDDDGNTTEPIPFDIAGNARFIDDATRPDTGEGTAPIVDMGARELHPSITPGAGACCVGGSCIDSNQAACLSAGGTYQGNGTTCGTVACPELLLGDMNGDGVVDGADIQPFLDVLLY